MSANWREASASQPCPICESKSWCSASKDGRRFICRKSDKHATYGKGIAKNDKGGVPYWLFVVGSEGPYKPPVHSHKEGATNPATPEERDRVYRKFLNLLPSTGVREELHRRGVPDGSQLYKLYKFLPIRDRAKICRDMIDAGLEPVMARTPGFFVQEKNGSSYWTCSGKDGLVIPVLDRAGQIVNVVIRIASNEGGKYR